MLEFSIEGQFSEKIVLHRITSNQLFEVLRNIDQISTLIEIGFDICLHLLLIYISLSVAVYTYSTSAID